MAIKGKFGFSDMSILVIIVAVVIFFSVSIFFGNLGSKEKIGKASGVFNNMALEANTDTLTITKDCGPKPKTPECHEYKNFNCVNGAWQYDDIQKTDNTGCDAGNSIGICCAGSCVAQPDSSNCGTCGTDCSKNKCSTGKCTNDLMGRIVCEPKPDPKGDCKSCDPKTGFIVFDSSDHAKLKSCCLSTDSTTITQCNAEGSGAHGPGDTCQGNDPLEKCISGECAKLCRTHRGLYVTDACTYCGSSTPHCHDTLTRNGQPWCN